MIVQIKTIVWKIRRPFYYKYHRCRLWLAKRIPLQDKIVFCNHFGNGFADDPKYIALALLQLNVRTKMYWMTQDLNIELPSRITPVLYGSFDAQWHLHTAKVWVYNYKNAFKVQKREGQYYVQTWHGSFALKKVEKDTEAFLSDSYLKETRDDSEMIDLMYSNNEFKRHLFKHSFWYKGEVIQSDSPQLSVLINTPPTLRRHIYSQYGIAQGKKVLLYAPSFRNEVDTDVFKFDFRKVLNSINRKFQSDFVVLLRLHPNNAELSKEFVDTVYINVTYYPDIDELMAITDVMITDFSGVAFDMAIKRSPVFLFAKDYEKYIADERGLYMSIEESPFSIAKDEDTLCRNITEFDESAYLKNVEAFFQRIGLEESGNGDRQIASTIMEKVGLK